MNDLAFSNFSIHQRKLYLIFTCVIPSVIANGMCSSETPQLPKYHLIERCYRSKLGIAAKANFSTLIRCQRLAIEKRGLSLNFSPPEARGSAEYSCEVLKCAESDGGQSLLNDSWFDHYSIYGRPIPDVNSTCVPTIGMFHLLPMRMNYTLAAAECANRSSVLPDVTSEQRTDAVAQLLAGAGVDAALTHLTRRNSSVFVANNENTDDGKEFHSSAVRMMKVEAKRFVRILGDTLDCTTFRAWAPGHPRKNFTKFDCMLITHTKTWLSTPCKKKFPVLCELISGGPYKRGNIFASQRRKSRPPDGQPEATKNKQQNNRID